jgi:serine protease Do
MRIVGASLLAVLACAGAAIAADPTEADFLAAVEKKLKAANAKTGPSVACVVVSKSNHYPKAGDGDRPGKLGGFDKDEFLKLNPTQKQLAVSLDLADPLNIVDHGYACGVVIDTGGLILTPYHVVEDATKIYVHLPGRGGSYADIHAADARHDLAVLKLLSPPAGLVPITFGAVRLREQNGKPPTVAKGNLTILMANKYVPNLPMDTASAAIGSVQGFHAPVNEEKGTGGIQDSYYNYGWLIKHDAKLNTGIDGAPLLNLDGEMIGLTTSTPSLTGERGPSYAFPTGELFRNVVDVLRRGEEVEYGYLGVSSPQRYPLPPQKSYGIIFPRVMPRGPASRAGIDERDVLTHVNGVPVTTYEELLEQITPARAGTKVKLTLLRDKREWQADVTLGKYANKQPFIASVRPEPVFGLRVDYSSVLVLALIDNDQIRANGAATGVCVRELVPNSPAAKKLGDRHTRLLITRVNGTEVSTPAEFYKAARGQQSIKLTVQDPTEVRPRDQEVTLP